MYYKLQHLEIDNFEIESECLKGNPLGDPHQRIHPVLSPKQSQGDLPLVMVLAGFTGNGPFYLNRKFGSKGFVDVLDEAIGAGQAPAAHYVLIDGLTYWGGSQFINSPGCGRYQDHLVDEVLPQLISKYAVDSSKVAVIGGSSGGYGALHLSSLFPEKFQWAAAIAPDSCFELSLLPELISTQGKLRRLGGIEGLRKMMESGQLFDRRDWHDLLNVTGMAYCYSPMQNGLPTWPLDWDTAETTETWNKWLEQDPVNFLPQRVGQLKKLSGLFLEVGNRDQFLLHYGARRIHRSLDELGVDHHFDEFDGTHFDIGSRRLEIWKWLTEEWSE